MKKFVISTAVIMAFLMGKSNFMGNESVKHLDIRQQSNYLIDSLQGKWFDIDDSTNKLTIQNNYWYENYLDINNNLKQVRYKIYFSDTLIDFSRDSLSIFNYSHNTNQGKFLILSDSLDRGSECFCLNGFAYYLNDTTFSVSPVSNFKANANIAFQKYQ